MGVLHNGVGGVAGLRHRRNVNVVSANRSYRPRPPPPPVRPDGGRATDGCPPGAGALPANQARASPAGSTRTSSTRPGSIGKNRSAFQLCGYAGSSSTSRRHPSTAGTSSGGPSFQIRSPPGEPGAKLYGDPGGDFEGVLPEQSAVAAAFADLEREQAATDAEFVRHPDPAARIGRDRDAVRGLWMHRIEEHARHCGHADLLRERVDGRTGQ
ncbi:DUF664 domain-containing protein [Kitasatospora sp. NPDC059795]|uniref:mycothiol transferase n=1 Tax=Kitasatospora sp. NPDC059795 TaxID=3346949 RepID=UPI0036676DF7